MEHIECRATTDSQPGRSAHFGRGNPVREWRTESDAQENTELFGVEPPSSLSEWFGTLTPDDAMTRLLKGLPGLDLGDLNSLQEPPRGPWRTSRFHVSRIAVHVLNAPNWILSGSRFRGISFACDPFDCNCHDALHPLESRFQGFSGRKTRRRLLQSSYTVHQNAAIGTQSVTNSPLTHRVR